MKSVKNKKRFWFGILDSKAQIELAKLVFYCGKTIDVKKDFQLDEGVDILSHSEYNPAYTTTLYIHGYNETQANESIEVIVKSYLQRGDHNVILLDWSLLADGNYFLDAVPNCKQLAPKVAKALIDMFNGGLDIDKFHIVGHSLGGQLNGLIAREVFKQSNRAKQIIRISSLDPAFPQFYPSVGVKALNKKDAKFVDVIHTDAFFYGAPVSTGTVDFWPNGGKTLQPGCPPRNYEFLSDNDLSSHRRSWWFWAETVKNKDVQSFPSVSAKSWSHFKKGQINKYVTAVMGINCSSYAEPGNYYLQTNGYEPFSKGDAGMIYEKKIKK